MPAVKWFIEGVKNPTRAQRLGHLAQIAHLIRTGKLYDCHPNVIAKLADDLDQIANGKDANSILVGGKKGREKTMEAELDRVSIAAVARYYNLQGHPLHESKDSPGAYELARQQLEAMGRHVSAATIQTAYLEQRVLLERTEDAFRQGTIQEMREPWWMQNHS